MSTNNPSLHPRWMTVFLVLDFFGLFLFLLGFQPRLFGLDRSPISSGGVSWAISTAW